MNKLLAGLAALPFLAGVATAGQPTPLTNTQMDQVTAGLAVWFVPAAGLFVVANPGTLGSPTPGPGTLVGNYPSLDGVGPPFAGFPSVTKGPTIVVP